jgi:hypothetical protein
MLLLKKQPRELYVNFAIIFMGSRPKSVYFLYRFLCKKRVEVVTTEVLHEVKRVHTRLWRDAFKII